MLFEGPSRCRSHGCGTLAENHVGDSVTICGWVDKYRNLGGLLFLDIRDHTGIIQVVSDDSTPGAVGAIGDRLRQEWVVKVTGQLRQRQDVNQRMQTGGVEVVLTDIKVLNSVNRPLPFPVSKSDEKAPPRCASRTPGESVNFHSAFGSVHTLRRLHCVQRAAAQVPWVWQLTMLVHRQVKLCSKGRASA